MTLQTTSPFGKIALCLSGGGYRAAAFALGTVDMLDELGLLDDVKLFSTVSGGTFTGVTYAAWMREGKSYAEFYKDLYQFLKTTNCIDLALDDLYKTPSPSGANNISLIRSAAKAYNDQLFKGRKFEPLFDLVGEDKRFLELIFNSTEFRRGNSFRFRASYDPDVNSGSGSFKVANKIAGEILLADIVAASSCFPAVFEPLRFPDDFYWESKLADIRRRLIQKVEVGGKEYESGFEEDARGKCISLPLMDGGVFDNQGTYSASLADDDLYKNKHDNFGLFIISDTTARDNDMFNYPSPDEKYGWLTINMLFWGAVLLFAFSLVSAGMLIYWFIAGVQAQDLTPYRIVFQYVAPITVFVVFVAVLGWAYNLFRKNKEIVIAGGKFQLWDWVKRLTMPDFINMAKARFTSLGTMSADVFMKRVRQLQFNLIMSDPDRRKKVVFNLIYDLNPTTDPQKPDVWILDPSLKPTDEIKKISKRSEAVKTTLWFEGQENDLRLLIVCGHCTTVYSLLRYLWQRWFMEEEAARKEAKDKGIPVKYVPKPNSEDSIWFPTYQYLHSIWEKLKIDPNEFVNRDRGK